MTNPSLGSASPADQRRKHPGTAPTTLDRRRELADFLARRRGALRPADVGLPDTGGRRRTPGLRREELATLAGVSVDWYIRLEQGRIDRSNRPSPAVLDALSTALRLSPDERDHLYALARGERPPLTPVPREDADESLVRMLEILPGTVPAFVLGRRWDVLAWNDAAVDLLVPFGEYPPERRNLLWLTFRDENYRSRYADWAAVAEETVANFRATVARHLELPQVQTLIRELAGADEDFARWWSEHHVREKSSGVKRFHWRGTVTAFRYDTVVSPANPDQRLVTYLPDR
jgi:transcriptional regulator with XRE-family HTH domain